MRLPIEISPNPLVTSTIELRYSSSIESSKLLPLVYHLFMTDLPNLEVGEIPRQVKNSDPKLRYAPDFILSNESYRVSFSNAVLSFEHVADYKLWKNYFRFISDTINAFFKLNHVQYVERIGLRYASILDNSEGVKEVIKQVPNFSFLDSNIQFEQYRGLINVGDFNLLLQIIGSARANKNNNTISGVYIDIDASYNHKIQEKEKALKIINELHTEEKKLFFNLLNAEYVNSLNPKF